VSPAIPAPEINTLICCSWWTRSQSGWNLRGGSSDDLKLSEQALLSIG
jgi:hypothetical protein